MMPTKLYEGMAQGTRCQVAIKNGNAFVRHWTQGYRGYAWTKWRAFTPSFPTTVYSKVEGMEHVSYQVEMGSRVSVGCSDLPLVSDNAKGIRVPPCHS